MDRIRKIQRRERIMKVKLSLKVMLFTAIVAGILIYLLAMPVGAETRMIEKKFTYGSYAPVISIDHGLYKWSLETQNDGSLKWSKVQNRDSQKQLFLILPTDTAGYYVIREMTSEHSQRVLTYTKNGFRMEYPSTDKYGMQKFSNAQKFRFKWYSSTTCGGRTIKNCWRLVCKKDNVAFCRSGWGTVKLLQMNA